MKTAGVRAAAAAAQIKKRGGLLANHPLIAAKKQGDSLQEKPVTADMVSGPA
jgi:hypothetical protein